MKKLNSYPLTCAIKKILAIGASGLILISPSAWAEAYINPHEIPLSLWGKDKICVIDLDQDGDLDIINYYDNIITQQENIGSLTAPLFAIEKVVANRRSEGFKTKILNDNNIHCSHTFSLESRVDIDSDGDLDRFVGHSASVPRHHKALSALQFYKNTGSELINQQDDLGLPLGGMVFTDIDRDGDLDYFGKPVSVYRYSYNYKNDIDFYSNIGSPEKPIFVKEESPISLFCDIENDKKEIVSSIGARADINGDGLLDMVCLRNTMILSSQEGYVKRKDVFQLPSDATHSFGYKINALDIDQNKLSVTYFDDTQSFKKASLNGKVIVVTGDFNQDASQQKILEQCHILTQNPRSILIDFDGDNDLDLFAAPEKSAMTLDYCENKGSVESPLFSSHITFDLFKETPNSFFSMSGIMLADRDGDGDKDMLIYSHYAPDRPSRNSRFFDNIGTSKKPLFQSISHTPFTLPSSGTQNREYWLDLDHDGKIESSLIDVKNKGLMLLYKGKEAATSIEAVEINNHSLIIAINRPSQTQLYNCDPLSSSCSVPVVLPYAAKEIRLSAGNFIHTLIYQSDEIALATIDSDGMINVHIYGPQLKLLSHGKGGSAHSLSISSGQLDHDDEDEFVVSFVQPDETVVAASVNFDMSIIGVTQLGKGKHPSVAVGHFANDEGSYALSYITPDNQLKTATINSNGAFININDGGAASDAKISKATFIPNSSTDEYVVSTLQTNGIAGLIGFSSNGEVLGQLTGGVAQQPTVISRYSSDGKSIGLAVSIIQADKKPAVIFLDNQGNVLATGVGGKKAVMTTLVNSGSGSGNTTLVYVDERGVPRWEVFGVDGDKIK